METFSAKKSFEEIRSYLAGRFVGSTRDEYFLEEIIKMLFCKHEMTRNDGVNRSSIANSYRKCFRSLASKHPDIFDQERECEIDLDSESIEFIDSKLSMLDLSNLQRDIMGDAYETFMGSTVKGQSGQFFTPKNAAEALVSFVKPKSTDKVLDLACGAGGFLSAATSYVFSHEGHDAAERFVANNIYGVDKDAYLARLAKIRLASLYQSTGHISCADSLVWDTKILGPAEEEFDVILTNPPFGSNINSGSIETLSQYEFARKYRVRGSKYTKTEVVNEAIPPQVVFLERCLKLLKPGGKLGIVIPESMISSKKYGYVSEYLINHTNIEAIAGMPEDLFKTSGKNGTHTKTCLLYLKREQPTEPRQDFFAAEAKWCGHDSRGREIPNDDIPTIVEKYDLYESGGLDHSDKLGCSVTTDPDNLILAPRSFTSVIDIDINALQDDYKFIKLGDLISQGYVSVSTGDEVGKLEYGTGDIPFIRTSDISNWGISFDSKHKISEEKYNSLKAKQDVQEGDILMVKDGGYLIGTCALVTELDTRIVYQSHIFKFRVVRGNDLGLTPFYLLAVLSSNYVRKQVEAKTCTLDIINSLGDRYRDLILPIAKDKEEVSRISQKVEKAISERVKARKLIASALSDVELLK